MKLAPFVTNECNGIFTPCLTYTTGMGFCNIALGYHIVVCCSKYSHKILALVAKSVEYKKVTYEPSQYLALSKKLKDSSKVRISLYDDLIPAIIGYESMIADDGTISTTMYELEYVLIFQYKYDANIQIGWSTNCTYSIYLDRTDVDTGTHVPCKQILHPTVKRANRWIDKLVGKDRWVGTTYLGNYYNCCS